jgi:DNA-binding response OmpR family regulator/TolB-like protein
MRKRLLVVAKDVGLRRALARWLAPVGYAIELAEGAKRARDVLAAGEVAAGILRIERLDAAFSAVARELRELGSGVIIVVDHTGDIDRLRRFGIEADAYLAPPLQKRDVLDRVESVVPTIGGHDEGPDRIEAIRFNGMTLDVAGHLLINRAGSEVELTRGELAVLAALVRRPGRVLSRDQLLQAVSGRSSHVFDRSIDNLIARLRRKIEPEGGPHVIVTVRSAGYKFSPQEVGHGPGSAATPQCSILVFPFADAGGGPQLAHFATAVSTNLITELRHVVGSRLLCWQDNSDNATEIGRQLGARYVLCGAVRRSADAIRVNARMTEVQTGLPVWDDRFDGNIADIFVVETELTARIVRAIELAFIDLESRCGGHRDALSGLDLVTRGYAYLYRPRSVQNVAMARRFFEQALHLGDRRAESLAGLAHTHISDVFCRWSGDPDRQVELADASMTRAIEIDPRLAFAYHVRGLVLRVQQQYERALAAFDMAAQLKPSLAPAHAEIGFTRAALDRGDGAARAHEGLVLARRISPRDPVLANWLYGIGVGHLKRNEKAEAIRFLNESIGLNPLPPALAYLASAHALNGDDARARSTLCEFMRAQPHETLGSFGRRLLADHQIFPGSLVFEGLRKAGLREQ